MGRRFPFAPGPRLRFLLCGPAGWRTGHAGRTKTAFPSHGIAETAFDHGGRGYFLEDELCDPVASAYADVFIAVVEDDNADVSSKVAVDDARAYVGMLLPRKPGTGGDAAVMAEWDRQG